MQLLVAVADYYWLVVVGILFGHPPFVVAVAAAAVSATAAWKHSLLLVSLADYYRLVVVGILFRHPLFVVAVAAAAVSAAAATAAWKHPLLLGVWWHQQLAFWLLSSAPVFSGMMGFSVVAWFFMQSRA